MNLNETELERFWAKVDTSGDCWLWRGSTQSGGYPQFWLDGTMKTAHRLAYELATGINPGKLHVLHSCDTPTCVRPSHLSLGTHAQNMADMASKGRASKGEAHAASKLSDTAVAAIRQLYSTGDIRQHQLATLYGVSQATISDVCNLKRWKVAA